MSDHALKLKQGDYVSIPANPNYDLKVGDFTLTALIKTSRPGRIISRISAKRVSMYNGFHLLVRPRGRITVEAINGSNNYQVARSGDTNALDGEWHHIIAVRSNGELSLYFDCKPVELVGGFTTSAATWNNPEAPLLIGRTEQQWRRDPDFIGEIQDVSIWNRALIGNEKLKTMFNMIKGDESGLVGYWSLNGNTVDSSPTGNDGVIQGDAEYVPVFNAVWCHGMNNFSFCTISAGDKALNVLKARNLAGSQQSPLDDGLNQVDANLASDLINDIFQTQGLNPSLGIGQFNEPGTVTTSSDSSIFKAVLNLGEEVPLFEVTTIVKCASTRPLTNWGWYDLNDALIGTREVWTKDGWSLIPNDQQMVDGAVSYNGKYYYQVLLADAKISGRHSASIESGVFNATLEFFTSQMVDRIQEITVAEGTSCVYAMLMTALDDPTFPQGAKMSIEDPDETYYNKDTATDSLNVHMIGKSVYIFALKNPKPGEWYIRIEAPHSVQFQLFFQSIPSGNDIAGTIRAALGPIYDSHEVSRRSLAVSPRTSPWCFACTVVVASLAGLLITAVVTIGIVAILAGPVGWALTAMLWVGTASVAVAFTSFLGWKLLIVAEIICYKLGACPEPPITFDDVISQERGYDKCCYLTSHNAFSYGGLMKAKYSQQSANIPWQMDRGASALMLDIHLYNPSGDSWDVYLCHENCAGLKAFFTNPHYMPMTLKQCLDQVVAFLRKHPKLIITLLFQSCLEDNPHLGKTLVNQALEDSGASQLAFYADRTNTGTKNESWNVSSRNGWPTRQWMTENGLRLVLLSDRQAEKSGRHNTDGSMEPRYDDGLPYLWQNAVESVYGDESLDTDMTRARVGSSPLEDTSKNLFILNHFPKGSIITAAYPYYYDKVNDYKISKEQIDRYSEQAKRLPNFFACNFIEYPKDHGPSEAVGYVNEEWVTRRKK